MATPRAPVLRPRFTLMVIYFGIFFVLFCLVFALTDLLEGARSLPVGPAELSQEELDRASEIAHRALGTGQIYYAFGAALIATGLGVWRGILPGLRS